MQKMVNQNRCRAFVSFFLVLVLTVSFFGCGRRTASPSSQAAQDTQSLAEQMEERLEMKVVTVLMDLPQLRRESDPLPKSLAGLPGYGSDFTVQVDSISATGNEYDAALTRLRTEIMAGKGPDLFICGQKLYWFVGQTGTESFFHFPEQAMSNHLFMQLDDYIKEAKYIEWDKLQPMVMEAGRNDEGFQLLPLTYTFEATFFDSSYKPESQFPMTWDEMIDGPDQNIRAAASYARTENILRELADYDKDAPAFSEDELKRVAAKSYATRIALPEELRKDGQPPNVAMDLEDLSLHGISLTGEQEYTIIPTYNLSGGITANITTFAAINRNARHPDEAFKIIDYLLSPSVQQTSPIFQSSMQGMPVYVNIGDEDTPSSSKWRMNDSLFKQINEAQKQINVVKFAGPLDECLNNVLAGKDDELAEKSGHEQYVLMEMLLAES